MQSFILATILSLVSASPSPQGLGLLNGFNSGSTSNVASGNSGLLSGLTSSEQSSNNKGIETGFGLGTDSLLGPNSQKKGSLSGLLGKDGISSSNGLGSNFGSTNKIPSIGKTGLNSVKSSKKSSRTNSRPNEFQSTGFSESRNKKGSKHGGLKNKFRSGKRGDHHGISFNSFEPINGRPHHSSRGGLFKPHHKNNYSADYSDKDNYHVNHRKPNFGQREAAYLPEEY